MNTNKALAAAVLALAGLGVHAGAHAGVSWSVQIGLPVPVITLPAPRIEVRPVHPPVSHAPTYPVYSYPAPAYPVYSYPAPAHPPRGYGPPAWRDRDRDGVPDWRDPYDNRRHGWRNDRDRDGIPDHWDRRDDRRAPPAWRHPDHGDDRRY